MREIFKYGSVGRALGDQCLYPETEQNDDVSNQNTNVAKDIDYGYGYM